MGRSKKIRSQNIRAKIVECEDESQEGGEATYLVSVDFEDPTLTLCECHLTELLELLKRAKRIIDRRKEKST